MQEINNEYDILFTVWKIRDNVQTAETATTSRSEFYTQNGWKGTRHDWNRSLKDIAQIVRAYVKQKYPNYKFSVRTSYASMCQELHVQLKESPVNIYKKFEELTDDDKNTLRRRMMHNHLFKLNCWSGPELKAEFERIWKENGNYYRCLNDVTQAVIDDVDKFVKSYNYEDCDGQIDYCNVDFIILDVCKITASLLKLSPKPPESRIKLIIPPLKKKGAKIMTKKNYRPTPEQDFIICHRDLELCAELFTA